MVSGPSTSEPQRTTDKQNAQHQRRRPQQDEYDDRRNLDELHERIARRFSLRREGAQRRRLVQLVLEPAEGTTRHVRLPVEAHFIFALRTNRFGIIHTVRVEGMPRLRHKPAALSAIKNLRSTPRRGAGFIPQEREHGTDALARFQSLIRSTISLRTEVD